MDVKPIHILLLEDNQHDYLLMKRALQHSELLFEVTWLQRGEEAIRQLSVQSFDVVIVDFILPDTTGLYFFQQILQQDIDLPIIFVTGTGSEQTAVDVLKLGAQDYLVKDPGGEYLKLLPMVVLKTHRQWEERVARRRAELSLQYLNQTLERQVSDRTQKLNEYAIRLEILRQMDQAILSAQSAPEIAQVAVRHVRQLLPCNQVSVAEFDWERSNVHLLAVESDEPVDTVLFEQVPFLQYPETQLLQDGKTAVINHITSLPLPAHVQQTLLAQGIEGYMITPLTARGKLLGCLNVGFRDAKAINAKLITIAQEVAAPLAVALQQARLLQTEREQREIAETLSSIGKALTTTLDVDQVLQLILEQLARVISYYSATLMLLSDKTLNVVARHSINSGPKLLSTLPYETLPHVQRVLQQQEPLIVPDTTQDPGWQRFPGVEYIRCWMGVPLVFKEEVIGLLNLNSNQVGGYTWQNAEVALVFASIAATAIENARLFQQAQQEIRERKQAEQALAEERVRLAQRVIERTAELSATNAELARTARAKDDFLASMSHELRTPLNAILGKAETLEEGIYGALVTKQVEAVRIIQESGRHLLELINDILDVAKIEAGKLQLELGPVSVESICQSSLRLVVGMAHKKNVSIETSFAAEATSVYADGRRLKQILVNLLTNAVKFTIEGGRIGLTVRVDEGQNVIHFTVWDTGIGISSDGLHRLFADADVPATFVQLDSSLSRQYQGTGLGLSLVYRLTEMHGGHISLETAEGQGSRFTVTLPWKVETTYKPEQKNGGSYGTAELPLVIASPLILLCEDNEANLATITDYLQFTGFGVVVARNGYEAIERAEDSHPDLILMDIQMPKLDGLKAIQHIRQQNQVVPIIALTALAMPGDEALCLQAGANHYLSKPVQLADLVNIMYTHLPKQ